MANHIMNYLPSNSSTVSFPLELVGKKFNSWLEIIHHLNGVIRNNRGCIISKHQQPKEFKFLHWLYRQYHFLKVGKHNIPAIEEFKIGPNPKSRKVWALLKNKQTKDKNTQAHTPIGIKYLETYYCKAPIEAVQRKLRSDAAASIADYKETMFLSGVQRCAISGYVLNPNLKPKFDLSVNADHWPRSFYDISDDCLKELEANPDCAEFIWGHYAAEAGAWGNLRMTAKVFNQCLKPDEYKTTKDRDRLNAGRDKLSSFKIKLRDYFRKLPTGTKICGIDSGKIYLKILSKIANYACIYYQPYYADRKSGCDNVLCIATDGMPDDLFAYLSNPANGFTSMMLPEFRVNFYRYKN